MYALIFGCVISTLSSLAPMLGEHDAACQLQLWLYGYGFVITTSVLYIKMRQMQNVIDHSLKMTGSVIKIKAFDTYKVLLVTAAGETIILALWLLVAPLEYKRSCIEKEEGGVWNGVCIASVGKCRTKQGPAFVALLSAYHVGVVMFGIKKCYEVRNLPSVMAEGKWVFTGYYSQLQVFVTAIPVLIMVRDDRVTFIILKSLVICFGDLTTLGMIFVPKMFLLEKYYDFSKPKISEFISENMADSIQQDTIYNKLKVEDPRKKNNSAGAESGSVNNSAASSAAVSAASTTN